VRTVVFPGVLPPPSDTRLLAATFREHGLARGARVLDVFTGSGALAVEAALAGAAQVTAVDISRRAVLNARLNARINRVAIDVRRGDLFAPLGGQRFDLILANPPYLPGPEELPDSGAARAWEGGADGRVLIDRFCREAGRHLRPGGTVLMVHSSLSGEQRTLELLAASGMATAVLARERGPLGPVASARAELLERRGLLAAGEREEEMLVIRAKPAAAPSHDSWEHGRRSAP
jgi:release factor glutamine methyltransferase